MTCDRCGKQSNASTGSWFSMEQICLDCSRAEEEHPDYEYARRMEAEAVANGDFNYPGIGWTPPRDPGITTKGES